MLKEQQISQIAEEAKETTLLVLDEIVRDQPLEKVGVRLWDGSYWPDRQYKPATIVLNYPGALKEMLFAGSEASMGEAYLYNAFDIEGNVESVFELVDLIIARTNGWTQKLKFAYLLNELPDPERDLIRLSHETQFYGKPHSLKRDVETVRFHYDVSNDFYALWLDPLMIYSCAYFKQADDDLKTAQSNKLDYICRKLNLKPGDRLLDIGCGWGGLIIHAAQNYGVEATGITLSKNQADLAQRRIQALGLQDQISVCLQDYRELEEWETYDAIASIGMVEHVGAKNLSTYFQKVSDLLKPGGLFLNHGICLGAMPITDHSESFIDKFVFPDSELLPISLILNHAKNSLLEIRDVENLREHYTLTLRHWVKRLEDHYGEALNHVDETIYRIWRIYMAGSAHAFNVGNLNIYQTLLAKLDSHGKANMPLTRNAWYSNEHPSYLS